MIQGSLLKGPANDSAVLYGVISIEACGRSAVPSIHMRVIPYLGWIRDNMKGLPPGLNGTCKKHGECNDSKVESTEAQDYTGCLMDCKDHESCKWFTYHNESKLCVLFSGCKEFDDTQCPNCVSSEVTCPVCKRKGKCQITTILGISFPRDIIECQKVW